MKITALLSSVLLLGTTAAHAQDGQMTCASGQYSIIRISRIKPSGSIAGFGKAVADHVKWYADHGHAGDRISWAVVTASGDGSGPMTPAKDMVMTTHTGGGAVPPAEHDAAWDAFVAEYDANSQVVSMTMGCVQP